MRLILAIVLVLSGIAGQSNAKSEPFFHTIFWKDALGRVAYEGHYRVEMCGYIPILILVEGYRHGPFDYRCLGPEWIDHGNGVRIRNYLPRPHVRHVPAGFKVCLQPALVNHGVVNRLPYLYMGDFCPMPCVSAFSHLAEPVYYRPASLIPVWW